MVQTKVGAGRNAWLQYQRECAKRYKEEKSAGPQDTSQDASQSRRPLAGAGGKAAKAASPTKAQKAKEVAAEERKEKAKVTKA